MRSVLVCVGIATVLVASGCKRAEAPKTPDLPVPQCKEIPPEGVKSFTRLVHAMDRAGDLPMLTAAFDGYRKVLDAEIAKRGPALAQKLKPVLDRHFSQDALRARAACGLFVPLAAKSGGVAALDAWSRSPEMHAINVSIWTRAPVPSEEENAPNSARRTQRLRDIVTAMALEQVQGNRKAGDGPEPTALVAALDSAALSLPAPAPRERIDRAVLIEQWLQPALIKTSDEDIETFMNFVESPFGADYYVGNLHKWAWTPRSAGIIWAAAEHQATLHPPVISWGLDNGMAAEFDLVGTRDPSPFLAAPAALDCMAEFGGADGIAGVQRYDHELAWWAGQYLADRWGTPFTTPEEMIGTMVNVTLPIAAGSTPEDAAAWKDALLFEHHVEVPVFSHEGRLTTRVSAQLYNERAEIERLAHLVAAGR